MGQKEIIDAFHNLYYGAYSQTWQSTLWLGHPIQKCPMDIMIYQEIIHRIRPDVIVECGTFGGGSALFMATICDYLRNGAIISVDIYDCLGKPSHPRIRYLTGSSISSSVLEEIRKRIRPTDKVLVILDSDHRKEHVLQELLLYGPLVTMDSYMIVEDTNVNGNPVHPTHGPGPGEAVQEFVCNHQEFVVDSSMERLFFTFNPGGYLKRIRPR